MLFFMILSCLFSYFIYSSFTGESETGECSIRKTTNSPIASTSKEDIQLNVQNVELPPEASDDVIIAIDDLNDFCSYEKNTKSRSNLQSEDNKSNLQSEDNKSNLQSESYKSDFVIENPSFLTNEKNNSELQSDNSELQSDNSNVQKDALQNDNSYVQNDNFNLQNELLNIKLKLNEMSNNTNENEQLFLDIFKSLDSRFASHCELYIEKFSDERKKLKKDILTDLVLENKNLSDYIVSTFAQIINEMFGLFKTEIIPDIINEIRGFYEKPSSDLFSSLKEIVNKNNKSLENFISEEISKLYKKNFIVDKDLLLKLALSNNLSSEQLVPLIILLSENNLLN